MLVGRPPIVCLCGSTRFKRAYEVANEQLTLNGFIVLSVGCFGHDREMPLTPEQKHRLDDLHLEKIKLADCVLFLDVNGYLGESSKREREYAQRWPPAEKPIVCLNEPMTRALTPLEDRLRVVAFQICRLLEADQPQVKVPKY